VGPTLNDNGKLHHPNKKRLLPSKPKSRTYRKRRSQKYQKVQRRTSRRRIKVQPTRKPTRRKIRILRGASLPLRKIRLMILLLPTRISNGGGAPTIRHTLGTNHRTVKNEVSRSAIVFLRRKTRN
jgi:hypothetical protein